MRFDIGAGGTIVILVGLVGLSGAVFGLGLIAGHELASDEPPAQQAVASYAIPAAPAPAASAAVTNTAAASAAIPAAPLEPPTATDVSASAPVAVKRPVPISGSEARAASGSAPESETDRRLNQAIARLRARVAQPEHAALGPEDRIPPAPVANDAVPPPSVNYTEPAPGYSAKHATAASGATKAAKPATSSRRVALSTPPSSTQPHSEPYSIQIDAVMDRAGAQQMAAKLRARGFEPFIMQTHIGDQTW